MPSYAAYVPYCGLPPLPAGIWRNWNLDPVLLAVLGAALLAYVAGARRLGSAPGGIGSRERAAFLAGWTVLTLALVSPLCSLSVALFSARIAQHMLLLVVAAPLLVIGRPERAIAALLPAPRSAALRNLGCLLAGAPLAWLAFAVFLWMWHTPRLYAATFASDFTYWAMHVTLIGSALLLWRVLLLGAEQGWLQRLFVGFSTLVHMSILGALITLAPRLIYAPHLLTTAPWGLSALEDQQLGGLIMWVPGCSIFIFAALAIVAALLKPARSTPAQPLAVRRDQPQG